MPVRTFGTADLINITEGYSAAPGIGPLSPTLLSIDFGNFSLQASSGSSGSISFSYEQQAEINLAQFPVIPPEAIITKIRYKIAQSSVVSAHSGNGDGSLVNAYIEGLQPGSYQANQTSFGLIHLDYSYSIDEYFIVHEGEMSYAEFASFWTNPNTVASIQIGATETASYNLAYSNWQMEVTYILPPDSFTITPNTGVQPGLTPIIIVDTEFGLNPLEGLIADYNGGEVIVPIDDFTERDSGRFGFNMPPMDGVPSGGLVSLFTLGGTYIGDLELGVVPEELDFEMIGGITFSETVSAVFIADPSGIYTLVAGKHHDSLYERLGEVTDQDVKIPRPFVKFGFLP